jgi:hypothetical protein
MSTPTLELTRSLSSYRIDLELLKLLEAREDVLHSTELTPVEIEQTIATLDHEIAEYVPNALANRADDVAGVLKQWDVMDDAADAEIKRLQAIKRERQEARTYLENLILALIKRAGVKKIEGATVTLKAVKNPASCEVAQPDLVPDAYKRLTVTITADLYNRLMAHLMPTEKGAPLFAELMDAKATAPEPMLSKIKDELKAGAGVPGCRLVDDKYRLEIK